VLRCVSSEDGMTADWSRLPYEIWRISNGLSEVKGGNAWVLDITSKTRRTIEWEIRKTLPPEARSPLVKPRSFDTIGHQRDS